MEKIKLPYIDENAIASIEVGPFYYQRVKSLIPYILKDKEPEEQIKILTTLKDVDDKDIVEDEQLFHLQTVLLFIKEVEESFQEKGFIKEDEVEMPKKQD